MKNFIAIQIEFDEIVGERENRIGDAFDFIIAERQIEQIFCILEVTVM